MKVLSGGKTNERSRKDNSRFNPVNNEVVVLVYAYFRLSDDYRRDYLGNSFLERSR
jgi:hypothetical protein